MFLLLSLACTVVQGSGESATVTRDLTDWTAIDNGTFVDVEWAPGDGSAQLTCDDNLLDRIEIEVVDGELRIRTPPNTLVQSHVDCVLELTSPCLFSVSNSGSGRFEAVAACAVEDIHSSGSGSIALGAVEAESLRIHTSGSGSVQVDSVSAQDVDLHTSGSGGITLAGGAGHIEVSQSGSGGLDGAELVVDTAEVGMSGSGDSHLAVNESVQADLSGSGSLHIYGTPSIDADTSGSGDVVVHPD